MKQLLTSLFIVSSTMALHAQTEPAITQFMLNNSGVLGRHYISGNSTPIEDTMHANVQLVQYSANYSYINSSGIPGYIVGPYLDGNPALATNNEWLFKIPLNPVPNTGTLTATPFGAIAVLINGVPMYDYKDGASYSSSTGADDMMNGDGVWNRNAIMAENDGFDCAKGHPSPIFDGPPGPGSTLLGGTYHHHQNPTAFNMDLVEISDICDTYLADGLYTLDASNHSPLIGFAFDGYPIYGGYGYSDPMDVNSPIALIKPSYQKRNITVRTHDANGTDVIDGPPVSATFPLGWYREDYEFVNGSGDLDIHNGRFCITPEYPAGTYAYFATVDDNWNSTYPYAVGPTYYGIVEQGNFSMNDVVINEPVDQFVGLSENKMDDLKINIYPNPASDVVAIQVEGILKMDLEVTLTDSKGSIVQKTKINQGSTIWHLDTRTLYSGQYFITISDGTQNQTEKLILQK